METFLKGPPLPTDIPPHPPAAQRLCIPSAFHPSVPPPTSTHLTESNLNKADADEDEKIGDEESKIELNKRVRVQTGIGNS